MKIDFDGRGLREISTRYDGAGRLITGELTTAMRRVTLQIERRAKQAVPTDTHHLQRSLTSTTESLAGGVRGLVGTNVPYAKAVEEGRRAGAPMPPRGVLLGWMRRHGVETSAEFVVRRAISRRGIPAKPYLRPALQQTLPEARREFGQVAKRVLARLGSS